MEKLQPFLKQRYWICFGLALIFVLVGWWNASGDLAAKTDLRKKSVDESFRSADKGKTDPNEAWVAGGKKENESDAGAYKTAAVELWTRQQAAREWPEQIRSEMQKIDYFADINSKETRERWVSIYQTQIEDLLKIVQPFQHDTGEGLVLVDANRITKQPYNKWQIDLPSPNEIWSNQEDIWLLKALLTSISRTNDSATRITESQVPEIKRLTLRGGDRKTKPGAKTGGGVMGSGLGGMGGGGMGGGGMGGGGMGGGGMSSMGMGGGGENGMPGGGGAGHTHPGTAFEGKSGGDVLIEEFGAVAGAGGGGMGGFGGQDSGMMASMMGGNSEGSIGGGTGAAKTSAAKKEVRYVDDAEKDQGYKTRAFLLDVLIRDDRLPDLLAKLTNSDFPVEIVRVEILSRAVGGGGGMSGGGMPGGGMPGGGMSGGYGGEEGMAGGYGGGMSSGGMGMPGADTLGGLGGMPGGAGAMAPGMGRMGGGGSEEGFSGPGGMSGEGGYSGEGSGSGMMGAGSGAAKGLDVLNAAMADPLLIEVRIGGLLTLYMTPEESEMQLKTEETAAKEAEKSVPAVAEPGASDTQTGTEPGAIAVPETSDALNPGSEVPATGSAQDPTVPDASVPNASADGPPVGGGVPGDTLSGQGADPKSNGDGSPAVPAGENVPRGTSPSGTPSP